MEQEQILSSLKTGLGQTSLSERTITDFASVLEIPEDESLHGDYFSRQVKVLKTLEGQLSHDVASKVEDFKKSYKPQEQSKQDPPQGSDEMPSWAKELKEKIEAKEAREAEMEKSSLKEQKLSTAYAEAKVSGADNEAVLDIVKSLIKVEDEDTPSSLKDKIVASYNEKYKKLYGGGSYPSSNSSGSGSGGAGKDSFMEHLKAVGKIPK